MYGEFIQYTCIITVYHALQTSAANPDFGEFIEELLKSDKIGILIDKVAERVIEKLKPHKLEQHRDHNRDPPRSVNQHHNILRNSEANEKSNPKNPISSIYRSPGKIDMQAAREKYAEFPFEQLSLKYKHLVPNDNHETKAIIEKTTVKVFDGNVPNNYDGNAKYYEVKAVNIDHSPTKPEKELRSEENKKGKELDASGERPKFYFGKVREFEGDKDKSPITDNELKRVSIKTLTYTNDHNPKIQEKQKHWGFKPIMPETLKSNMEFRANDNTEEPKELSKESQNESGDKTANIDNEKSGVEGFEDGQTEKQAVTKLLVREEGGKLYAFEQSPDYEEYHEKLKKAAANSNIILKTI